MSSPGHQSGVLGGQLQCLPEGSPHLSHPTHILPTLQASLQQAQPLTLCQAEATSSGERPLPTAIPKARVQCREGKPPLKVSAIAQGTCCPVGVGKLDVAGSLSAAAQCVRNSPGTTSRSCACKLSASFTHLEPLIKSSTERSSAENNCIWCTPTSHRPSISLAFPSRYDARLHSNPPAALCAGGPPPRPKPAGSCFAPI